MYKQSKIYKITDDENNIYIGSTTQKYLSSRLAQHKQHTKKLQITTNKLVNPDTWTIQLLEKFECNDINELRTKERQYIECNECVNKKIPNRTFKEYYEDNKETIKNRTREYDKKRQQTEEYKQYRKEHYKEKITCECGAIVRKGDISTHRKTNKHQSFYK